MQGAFSKRVLRRIAANAHERIGLFHHADTSRAPRGAQVLFAVRKGTVYFLARAVLVAPAKPYFVRETLVANVSLFSASEAGDTARCRLCKSGDGFAVCRHMYFLWHFYSTFFLFLHIFFFTTHNTQTRNVEQHLLWRSALTFSARSTQPHRPLGQ